MNWPSWSVPF